MAASDPPPGGQRPELDPATDPDETGPGPDRTLAPQPADDPSSGRRRPAPGRSGEQ